MVKIQSVFEPLKMIIFNKKNINTNEFKQDEELVSNLTNMGFEINDVKQALTLAKNNKNFALNILMEPELLDQLIHEQVDNGSLNINIPQNSNNDASTNDGSS